MIELVFILLSVALLLLPLPLLFLTVVRHPRLGWPLVAAYLVIYVACSLSGEYTIANHGGADWRREWCPKYLVEAYMGPVGRPKADLTLAGIVFWPCVVIDHLVWHRTDYEVL